MVQCGGGSQEVLWGCTLPDCEGQRCYRYSLSAFSKYRSRKRADAKVLIWSAS